MLNKYSVQNVFIECKAVDKNKAIVNFNDNSLKLGIAEINQKHINRLAFMLARDLYKFAEQGGTISNLSANEVYKTLKNQ